jgi:glutaminyl-peptide cyclotransferase
MSRKFRFVIVFLLVILAAAFGDILFFRPKSLQNTSFSGERAFQDVITQMDMGPRTMGSAAHEQIISWSVDLFKNNRWDTTVLTSQWQGHQVQNIVAERGQGHPWIIIGAHYDSRFYADHDPDPSKRQSPVPGANDGASGVAVLIELARVLPDKLYGATAQKISLVLFDAEDNGSIQGWDWILGSRAYADYLSQQSDRPDAVVVIDMIGDSSLDIYKEKNSNVELTDVIWNQANSLGFTQFIPQYKYQMLDDHTPFLQLGIPAVDIIDFDYPYWHTTEDTADKLSAESLQAVGQTLQNWLTK